VSSEEEGLWPWLREQVEARKRVAGVKAVQGRWRTDGEEWTAGTGIIDEQGRGVAVAVGGYVADHVVMNQPGDVLARCEAELGILEAHYILHKDDRDESYEQFCIMPYSGRFDYGCVTCHYRSMGAVGGKGYCFTIRMLGSAYRTWPGYRMEWLPSRFRQPDPAGSASGPAPSSGP
jgi:hypothetical protein